MSKSYAGQWIEAVRAKPQPGDEPDALARLARLARDLAGDDCEAILALVSEAREEQRKALAVVARAPMAWRIGSTARDERYRALAAVQFMLSGRWGTCVDCPLDADGLPQPEQCVNTQRADHQLDALKERGP